MKKFDILLKKNGINKLQKTTKFYKKNIKDVKNYLKTKLINKMVALL